MRPLSILRPFQLRLICPTRKGPRVVILPEDPNCPECGARLWSRTSRQTRECQGCGHVQHLLTDREHWLRDQAEINAEIASEA